MSAGRIGLMTTSRIPGHAAASGTCHRRGLHSGHTRAPVSGTRSRWRAHSSGGQLGDRLATLSLRRGGLRPHGSFLTSCWANALRLPSAWLAVLSGAVAAECSGGGGAGTGRDRAPRPALDVGVEVVRSDTRLALAGALPAYVDSAKFACAHQPVDVHFRASQELGRCRDRQQPGGRPVRAAICLCRHSTTSWDYAADWSAISRSNRMPQRA